MWLSVWSEGQTVCLWSSWCHCHPKTPSLPHLNPGWFILLVLDKGPLSGSLCTCCKFVVYFWSYLYSFSWVIQNCMHRGAQSCPTSLQNWTLPRLDYRCWNDHWQSWETSDSEVLPSNWPCTMLIAVFAQWTNFSGHIDTHTHNRLMALYPGLPGWASTRRNIQPLTSMRKKKKDSHRQQGLLWASKCCWTQSSQRTTKVGRLDTVKCYIFFYACM